MQVISTSYAVALCLLLHGTAPRHYGAEELAQPANVWEQKIEPEKLRADFKLARQDLEEGHSGIYRYTSKDKLDALFDQAEKSLTQPLTMIEFCRVLAPVVAAIKCGHTHVALPRDVLQDIAAKNALLPLQVRVLDGKVYVFGDYSGQPTSLAGKEIRSINGVTAGKIVETMLAAAAGDGDVQTSRIRQISGWPVFSVQLYLLIGISAPYDLVVWDPHEKRELKVRLDGGDLDKITEAAQAKYPQDQRSRSAASLKFVDSDQIAVLKINQFGGQVEVDGQPKKTLQEFYKESFTSLKDKGTKTLILDLRNNGGGADELGRLLLSYLVNKPFQYYDDLVLNALQFSFLKDTKMAKAIPPDKVERQPNGKYRLVTHPNWGEQQPSQPTFAGTVLILINGGSFSTTSEFLSQAHFHKRATFIGEESGGGYYGNSSGFMPSVTLPNSKVIVRVPLMTYYMAVRGYKDAARGVIPDHPVRYSIDELLAGTDKELAVALELARR
jgi:C-terminal processing protease CtpA/Prc